MSHATVPSLPAPGDPRRRGPGQHLARAAPTGNSPEDARPAARRPDRRLPGKAAAAAAVALPGAPGLALAAEGHLQSAVPLLIFSGLAGLIPAIASTMTRIYESRQQTRRQEIQAEGPTAIARAMARCIDDAHAPAADVPRGQRAAEAARLRASAGKAVTQMMPALLAAIGQPSAQEPPGRLGTSPKRS
jgi:hypothetical protein